jgi:hypothetical protein
MLTYKDDNDVSSSVTPTKGEIHRLDDCLTVLKTVRLRVRICIP